MAGPTGRCAPALDPQVTLDDVANPEAALRAETAVAWRVRV
ncbi:hypothetical protein [Streptomyces sp. SID12501]|nr:hypothetical protein [Streptomyces sp. SID12501]